MGERGLGGEGRLWDAGVATGSCSHLGNLVVPSWTVDLPGRAETDADADAYFGRNCSWD